MEVLEVLIEACENSDVLSMALFGRVLDNLY